MTGSACKQRRVGGISQADGERVQQFILRLLVGGSPDFELLQCVLKWVECS